ncbi:hypothetical protein HK104_002864 [Borealophlyctis nickersoniae]|nr:hypothetical protein HK104_002864 [Borealophlyctis nickersoniae]
MDFPLPTRRGATTAVSASTGLTSGLIPIGGSAGAGKKLELDLDSDEDEKPKKKSGGGKPASSKEISSVPTKQDAPSSLFPSSRTSLPASSTSLPRPSSSTPLARPHSSLPQPIPVPAATTKSATDTKGDQATLDAILKTVGDIDDLDSNLFGMKPGQGKGKAGEDGGTKQPVGKPETVAVRAEAPIKSSAAENPKPAPNVETTAFSDLLASAAARPRLGRRTTSEGEPGQSNAAAAPARLPWDKPPQEGEPAAISKLPVEKKESTVGGGKATAGMKKQQKVSIGREPFRSCHGSTNFQSMPVTSQPSPDASDDDLLDLPGLDDDAPKIRPSSSSSNRGTVSAQSESRKPLEVNTNSSIMPRPSSSPSPSMSTPTSANRPSTAPDKPAPQPNPKPKPSDDDDYVPAFLLETSGPRRRGPPPSATGAGAAGRGGSSVPDFLAGVGQGVSRRVANEGVKTAPLEEPVVQSPSRPEIGISLPFLDAKPKIAAGSKGATNVRSDQGGRDESLPIVRKDSPEGDKRKQPAATEKVINPPLTDKAPTAAATSKPWDTPDTDTSMSSIANLSSDLDDDTDDESERAAPVAGGGTAAGVAVGGTAGPKVESLPEKSRRRSSHDLHAKETTSVREQVEEERRKRMELEKAAGESQAALQAKVKELESQLENLRAELSKKDLALAEAEVKFAEERASLYTKTSSEKHLLEDRFTSESAALKERHANEIERLEAQHKEDVERAVKLKMADMELEHQRAVAEMKRAHIEEIARVVSNGETSRQLEHLTSQVQNSSQFLDEMKRRMEKENADSVAKWEASFHLREKQVAELQQHLIEKERELDEERVKVRDAMKLMETTIWESKKHQEEERIRIIEQQKELEARMAEAQAEKDAALARLHDERVEFMKSKEEWAMEKKRMVRQMNEERKSITMEKAMVEAQKHMAAELELESDQSRARNEMQLHAERLALEKETRAMHARMADLHKEAAMLRSERLTLQMLRSQLDAERAVFESEREAAERAMHDAAGIRSSAAKECQKAKALHSEVEQTRASIDSAKFELEQQAQRWEQERKQFYKERLTLAEERRKCLLADFGKEDRESAEVESQKFCVAIERKPTDCYAHRA